MIRSLLSSSRPHIAAVIALSVRSRKAGRCWQRLRDWLSQTAFSPSSVLASYSSVGVVGREEALSRMRSWLEKMLGGERQIVFVAGEAGIGKTALVDTFAKGIASDRSHPDMSRAMSGTVRDE